MRKKRGAKISTFSGIVLIVIVVVVVLFVLFKPFQRQNVQKVPFTEALRSVNPLVSECILFGIGKFYPDADVDDVPDICEVCLGSNDLNDSDFDRMPNGCDAHPSTSGNPVMECCDAPVQEPVPGSGACARLVSTQPLQCKARV
ncbi:MAG: hypothetical protein QW559_01875 [Candidatus Woesearchaeota archaeon]